MLRKSILVAFLFCGVALSAHAESGIASVYRPSDPDGGGPLAANGEHINMDAPQPFGEFGVSEYDLNQMAMFPRGSLGAGSITTGWRRSENLEDMRSNKEIVSDEELHKSQQDNTAAERDNTEHLRKLIELLSRGNTIPVMDFTGGGGAGGFGGAFGAGQGPMFRPGVGPGSRASPARTVPVTPPPYVPKVPVPLGAKVSPGPMVATPAVPPASSNPAAQPHAASAERRRRPRPGDGR